MLGRKGKALGIFALDVSVPWCAMGFSMSEQGVHMSPSARADGAAGQDVKAK